MRTKWMLMAALAGTLTGTGLGLNGCSKPPAATAPATGPASTQKAVEAADPLVAIPAQVNKGIELLEAGKNRETMEALVKPDIVKKWKDDKEFDKVVTKFGESGKAAVLLAALKNAKDKTPTLNEKKTSAEFPHTGSERGLIFEKDKEGWYIRN